MFGLLLVVGSALVAAPQPAIASAVQTQTKAAAVATDGRLERSASAIDEGKFETALELVAQALDEGKLGPADSDWAWYLKARALAGLGKAEEAQSVARERHEVRPNGYTWASLVAIQVTVGRHDKAAEEILDLDEEQFIWVNRLRPALIESVVASLRPDKAGVRDRLIVRLVEGRFSGPASQRVPDTLRLRYINLLLRQNRIENAARQTTALESPRVLGILLSDRTFEPLWSHATVRALFAPGALLARVERGIQAQLEQPTLSSSDWLDIMRAYRTIGRPDEAVRLGLHALSQARSERRAAGPALRLEMARAYTEKGEPWAARRTARELLREEPAPAVELRVAIAQVLHDAGDNDGSLTLLGTLPDSARQPEVLRLVACAAHDSGQSGKRDAALSALDELGDRSLTARFEALVCTGAKDKAAETFVKMLAKDDMRTSAILVAQLYAGPATPVGDRHDMHYRLTALAASAAVQDAIKPHARSIALPFTFARALLD